MNASHIVTQKEREIHNRRLDTALDILDKEDDGIYAEFFERIAKPNLKFIYRESDEFLQQQVSKIKKEDKVTQIAKCLVCCNDFAHSYAKADRSISTDFFNLKNTLLFHIIEELEKDDKKKYPNWGFDDDGRFFAEIAGYGQINVHVTKLNISEQLKRRHVFANKRVQIRNAVALDLTSNKERYLKNASREDKEYNDDIKNRNWDRIGERNKHKYTYKNKIFTNVLCAVKGNVEKYGTSMRTMQQTKNMLIVNISENEGKQVVNIYGVDSYIERQGEIEPQHSFSIDEDQTSAVVSMEKVRSTLSELPNVNKGQLLNKSNEEVIKLLASRIKEDKQYIIPVSCSVKKSDENRDDNKDDYTYVGGNTGKLKLAIVKGKNSKVEYKDFPIEFQRAKEIEHTKPKCDINKEKIVAVSLER